MRHTEIYLLSIPLTLDTFGGDVEIFNDMLASLCREHNINFTDSGVEKKNANFRDSVHLSLSKGIPVVIDAIYKAKSGKKCIVLSQSI